MPIEFNKCDITIARNSHQGELFSILSPEDDMSRSDGDIPVVSPKSRMELGLDRGGCFPFRK